MKRFFQLTAIIAVLFLIACGGGSKKENKCPKGYTWSEQDLECVPNSSGDTGSDTGADTGSDTGSDTGADTGDTDTGDTDADTGADTGDTYSGDCTFVKNGGTLDINVETKVFTVGKITVNGKEADYDILYGELWAENKATLSEFKVGDIDSELSGKTMKFPKGRYNFSYKPNSSANKVVISENIDMASGDRTLDFDLPLYHLTGKVLNDSDSVFTAEEAYQESTSLTLKTGTFEKKISYAEFAGYDLLLPKGTYAVSFNGQLAAGQGNFSGTVLSSSDGIVVEEDAEHDIKVETLTFSGSVVNAGYTVNKGQLILVENPPFGSTNGIVVPDLSASTNYNITVTKGAALNLLYLPGSTSYPSEYIKLEEWNSSTETSHNITLDFARIHGKVTFLGGNSFPTVAKCTEADCTIGKLKATGFDYSSYLVKNFGTELEVEEDGEGGSYVTYEALLVRRIAVTAADDTVQYTPKSYSMNFESHLNDVEGIFTHLPFTVAATYENSEGKRVSSFSFYLVNDDETTTWFTEKEIDFDIAPSKISGKILLNGTAFTSDSNDLIRLKDENGSEYPVINLSEVEEGKYSFYAPNGTYDVLYDGSAILGTDYKTYIERDFEIKEDESGHDLEFKTGKIIFDFNVNGKPFADWAGEQPNLESIALAVNIDKTASDFLIDLVKKEGKYSAEILTGSTINAYLDLSFADKVDSERSFARVPVITSQNMTSGLALTNDLTLVGFKTSVKLNGEKISDVSDYAAKFRMQGSNASEIYYPAKESVSAFFKKGEYKTPAPELFLNEGFDTKQSIAMDCIYFGE